MSSSRLLKSNHSRGDFVFRDVYKRHAFSTFTGDEFSDSSTIYIDQDEDAVNCTSQVSTFQNDVGTLRLYTRNGQEIDKVNAASATVSANAASIIFRASNTHVDGGFSVKSLLRINPTTNRVGVNQPLPAYTLDVNGDCNIQGNILVNGNALSFTASSATFETTTPFLVFGAGQMLTTGLSFALQTSATGSPIVTASEDMTTFTIVKKGLYLIQAQVQGAYPFLPSGDVSTYFVKNGDIADKLGKDTVFHDGASAFATTKTYVLQADVDDTIAFIIDSLGSNEYEAGIQKCSIAFYEYGGGGLATGNAGNAVVGGNVTSLNVTGDLSVLGNLTVNGSSIVPGSNTSFAAFESPGPFVYTGPGEAFANGVPFFNQAETRGTTFVTASGTDNSVFTFTQTGTFLAQFEIEGDWPPFPENDIYTYLVKNGTVKLGVEAHAQQGGGGFGCTRSILVSAAANDTLHLIIDSSSANEYVAGIAASRISFVNITTLGSHAASPTTLPSLNVAGNAFVQGQLSTSHIESTSGNLRLEAATGLVFSNSIYNSTTAAGASVSITGPGLLQRTTSSLRYKTAVENVQAKFSQNIYQLRPVWYRSLCDLDRKDWGWYGLIAEEVAAVDPRLCFWGPDGQVEGVMYDRIVPLLLKEQSTLLSRVQALEQQNASLAQKMQEIIDLSRS
jgi:hypothetical protein